MLTENDCGKSVLSYSRKAGMWELRGDGKVIATFQMLFDLDMFVEKVLGRTFGEVTFIPSAHSLLNPHNGDM
jgi:hypothetical protein